jgi:predicted nucleic acid-binding protein
MSAAGLVDTHVLVYRFDGRFPEKQAAADALLRRGIQTGTLVIAHQAITEFVAAVTRTRGGAPPILEPASALREAEDLMRQFPVAYPDDRVLRAAFRGAALYGLSWYDAHMWAYAEVHELGVLHSEDFEHGRWYGTVRVDNPFRTID